ncbi:MAG: small acid-soluble spore protein Tlp [Clostridiales bacterium]|nr:small acid-soluble spore protein Tlp [Clostridiales bacterium]
MNNKPNPDNRDDNVEKIQKNIDLTIRNMEIANDMIPRASDEQTKKELIAKNARREQALDGMRHEIKDEADYQKRKKQ